MIKSMTGFGRNMESFSTGTVTVEIRSVNHRFCEVQVRLPKSLASLEEDIKRHVQQTCRRGRIEVTLALQEQQVNRRTLRIDRSLAKQYYQTLKSLQDDMKLSGSIDISLFIGLRDLITVIEAPQDEDPHVKRIAQRVVRRSLRALDAMRRREGAVLLKDITTRLRTIQSFTTKIATRRPTMLKDHQQRLTRRVETLLEGVSCDPGKLAHDLAIFAERSDVTEEITRLRSHISQFKLALKKQTEIGKMLDFLLQEMGREINTIGSKANDAEISIHVVKIKGELEKIREQVQNIE